MWLQTIAGIGRRALRRAVLAWIGGIVIVFAYVIAAYHIAPSWYTRLEVTPDPREQYLPQSYRYHNVEAYERRLEELNKRKFRLPFVDGQTNRLTLAPEASEPVELSWDLQPNCCYGHFYRCTQWCVCEDDADRCGADGDWRH